MNNGFYDGTYPPNMINPTINDDLPMEQSYVENILRLNKGKLGKFYMSFTDSVEYRDKVFTGIIEQSGRDHIIISDPATGKWYLLLIIYLSVLTD